MSGELPGEDLAAELGVDNPTSEEKRLVVQGIQKIATRILASRLEEHMTPEQRLEVAQLLGTDDVDKMAQTLRGIFPDFEELQAGVIQEAKDAVLAKAEAVKDDPARLPEILEGATG